jgi:hypothetical protein
LGSSPYREWTLARRSIARKRKMEKTLIFP